MSVLHYIVLATLLLNNAPAQAGAGSDAPDLPIPASSPPTKPSGDVVTLKSGRILQGVKVVQTTPFKILLEVIPSLEPLAIPIKQVVSIEYGPRDSQTPPDQTIAPPASGGGTSNILQAVKISPELVKKMATPITDKTIEFNAQDLVNTLRSAGIMSGVAVSFGPQLEGLPREKRTVSLSLAGGITFDRFIRDMLIPSVPWLKVEYQFNSIYFDCS